MTPPDQQAEHHVPPEIIGAYGIVPETIKKIGGGMINITYRATMANGEPAVLQQLGDMFGETVVSDFGVVTEHLHTLGWVVPRTLRALNSELCVHDSEEKIWRAMTYIEHEPQRALPDDATYKAIGEQLGELHASLATLDYEPLYAIPHFHDTPYHADKLSRHQSQLSPEAKAMTAQVLDDYAVLPRLPDRGSQLLHGDPRTDNMLFRDGKPFTFIDFDTLMHGPRWIDIGDLLRSIAEDACTHNRELSLADLRIVTNGYMEGAGVDMSPEEFFDWSLVAARTIALELTMRFLDDMVEPYFVYDSEIHASRAAFDMERARLQRRVYDSLQQS